MSDRPVMLVSGASSGIGAATARLAAAQGYDVAIGYRSDAAAAEAVAADVRTVGGHAVTLAADLATPQGPTAFFTAFDAVFSRLDAFVNNAGVVDTASRIEDMAPDRLDRMFSTNLTGPFLCAGQAVRRMSQRYGGRGGVIINISSAAARLGAAGNYADYAAAKAGIDILTRALSDEVAADGIRVAGIRPGIILTPIHGKGGDAQRVERLRGNIPMQRAGTPEEVAEAILWLCSAKASYVTGTTLDVSGGR